MHILLIVSKGPKDFLIWIHHQSKRDTTTHYLTKNNHQEVQKPNDFLDHIIIIYRRNQVRFPTKTFHQKRTQTLETLALSQLTSIKSSNELREWLRSKQRMATNWPTDEFSRLSWQSTGTVVLCTHKSKCKLIGKHQLSKMIRLISHLNSVQIADLSLFWTHINSALIVDNQGSDLLSEIRNKNNY